MERSMKAMSEPVGQGPAKPAAANAPSPAPSSGSREQQLTLKVMRLTRPSPAACPAVGVDPVPASPHLAGQPLLAAARRLTGTQSLSQPSAPSLLLPQNFENIYLGETFTAYVCVHNEGATVVADVSVKADLQTSSQRVSLPSDFANGVPELAPGASLGQVLTYEVNHQGQHILVCAVQYTQPGTGEKQYFRKFFKFPVAKPLDVRTKFYNAESDEVYLEAQVENLTPLPMVLERVALAPSELYTSAPIDSPNGVFKDSVQLEPGDTRQYLYALGPKAGLPPSSFRGVSSIGKLDMVWRTGMGERGRLQTSALQRMAPGTGDLRLSVRSAPSTVPLHTEFEVEVSLLNASERGLEPWLWLEEGLSGGLVWASRGQRGLGPVGPGASLRLVLRLLAAAPGLHWLSGLRLKDSLLGRVYELDEIAQIFVTSHTQSQTPATQ